MRIDSGEAFEENAKRCIKFICAGRLALLCSVYPWAHLEMQSFFGPRLGKTRALWSKQLPQTKVAVQLLRNSQQRAAFKGTS